MENTTKEQVISLITQIVMDALKEGKTEITHNENEFKEITNNLPKKDTKTPKKKVKIEIKLR